MNRVGDLGVLVGVILIFYHFRSVDFAFVFALVPYFIEVKFMIFGSYFNALFLISFFLFIGSVGKSAQIGLHT
jgi:NADH:ubiquinone oxidoreductase subunit 5 (subunit L)/multisubunit Na+/H+ antiporter MnhA subunit